MQPWLHMQCRSQREEERDGEVGDPRAAEDGSDRVPVADQELHRPGGGVPLRPGRPGARGRRARRGALLRRARCRATRTATGSARSRCWSRSTRSTTRRCSCWRGSCTAPTSPRIATRRRSRAGCSRSRRASTCSTSATTASSSSRLPVYDALYAWCKNEVARGVSLVRVGFIAVPPGAKPGFDHADVYRAGRRMYVAHTGADRVDVLDCERRDVPALASGSPRRRRRPDRRGARPALHERPRRRPRQRLPLLGRASCSAASRSARTRTGSPTTAAGGGCTPSTSASRSARTAPPPSIDLGSMQVVAELPLPGRPRWARVRRGARPRLREHPRPGADRRRSTASGAEIERGVRGAERRAARTLARSATVSSAPPTAARSSCSTATAARCSRACRCRACPTSSCTTPSLRRLYVAIGEPGRRLQLRQRAARAPRDGRDGGRGAHDRLGSRRPPPVRLLPRQRRRRGVRGTRLSADARRIIAAQASARRSPTGSAPS